MSHLLALIKACAPRVTSQAPVVMFWPFDVARANYAQAVRAGLIERSLLASARFEHQLNAVEDLALGPLARRY